MIRLALLRHGHTQWNREGRIQGRTDIPLDAQAVEDLSRRGLPDPWHDKPLVASPLTRAIRTAELVSGAGPGVIPALTEMDWGAWEGQRAAELHASEDADYRPIETWGWHYAPPDGEKLTDVRDRVLPWVSSLQEDTLAVTHIGVMRVILASATGWHFDGPAPFSVKRNRLYIVAVTGGSLSLLPETPALPWRPQCG